MLCARESGGSETFSYMVLTLAMLLATSECPSNVGTSMGEIHTVNTIIELGGT